ncbi:[protein-PII] uridylyltransferase [Glaciecola sp. MH2013]|uniref:[protein-PII] uridylyltransferase n=1 Tax=Glaciecola sp. MH2013 TaxID=2785524 RepID=UPI0018A0A5D5|nr:[protein-PII] uridylyltransferase [Glaciecola sp. MH2013]MBF7072266.1 [protein-PII] uridylyltransferase [Glaciecola sp. MH2013]
MPIQAQIDALRNIDDVLDVAAFKNAVQQNYQWLNDAFTEAHVDHLVVARSDFTDALLCRAWQLLGLDNEAKLALCAVGGYGRGQLQPYSDIDLLILSEKNISRQVEEKVAAFITLLWDIKLEIGQAVRTVKETVKLAKADITIATNLVEARVLIGCEKTFDSLIDKVNSPKVWSSKDFFLAKLEEQQNRHHKFNDTSYNLEPNVKENPGCLRDIQSLGWVAKKHFREYDGQTLIGHGYFTEIEHAELIECRSHLWKIRFALHLVAKRSENRLLFDYQTDVAKLLGYGDDKSSVEQMMKAFFRIVRRVSELNSMLLHRFKDDVLETKTKKEIPLNNRFTLKDGLISPLNEETFYKPSDILDFLALFCEHDNIEGLDADCIRQVRNARRKFQDQYYHERMDCRERFVALMKQPSFFGLGWDTMYKYGILQSYLPEWDKIVGMMQFDLFHAYTVDEHTHRLVKHVHRYYSSEKSFPRCHRIVHNLDKPEILFIAAIFHDIAKGRGGDHSTLGAVDVLKFCVQHNIPQADANTIAWLVENHLLMSVVAQRRDIYDPEVINQFASAVKSHDQLNLLYALTLADIRATNDNLWNDWKASLLRELYLLTQQAFDNGLECQVTLDQRIEQHKVEAIELLAKRNINREKADVFWRQMRKDYFARFKPNQIAWHTDTIVSAGKLAKDEILVNASNKTSKAGTELLIYCSDRPALFAQIASVLDSRNCSIHDAQITVTDQGNVFDSMIILDQDANRIESENHVNNLVEAVRSQLIKPGRSHANKRKMSRQMKQLDVKTKVRFYSSTEDATLVELEALDAPGLLAKIGHLFVDLNLTLKLAKISTIGERAEDIFIVSNEDGKALTRDQEITLKKQLTLKLDQPEVNPAI